MSDEDNERWNRDSGPFCRHWYYQSDCEEICGNCSHRCHADDYCVTCDCTNWKETEMEDSSPQPD
jgi:hypothetical protein